MRKETKWRRVSRAERCPCCDHADYCTISGDGTVCHCMRLESDKPAKNGGWIHKLAESLPVYVAPEPVEPVVKVDAEAVARAAFGHRLAAGKREDLARKLGVTVASLVALRVGIGWDKNGEEWGCFPQRNGVGKVIGITRRYESGKKMTLKGTSNAGVFFAADWWRADTVYIVEGPSDVAALLSAGFNAVGRPSNIGGIRVLTVMLKRRQVRNLVVVGENDRKPDRPGTVAQCPQDCAGCPWCYPGRWGGYETARRLRQALRRSVGVLMPPDGIKDARVWLSSGLSFPGGGQSKSA